MSKRCVRCLRRHVPSVTLRSPSATRCFRRLIACGTSLRQLQRPQFGRHSEKLDPEQSLLALEDIEQAVAGNEAADDKKDPAAARARGATSAAPIAARFPLIYRAWV